MQCPFCKTQGDDKVVDSRSTEGGAVIRRRRRCLSCGRRFTTYERYEETNRLMVIKKDGSRMPYQREKLLGGIERACWKRPISTQTLQRLVDEVEEEVFQKFDREVKSEYLGGAVARRLRKVDKVAYLRFASLYHEFQLVDVMNEARQMIEQQQRELPGQRELFDESPHA